MINFANDFAVLHLSDIHIVAHHDNDYSTALHKMIDHIYSVTTKINKIVVVVTGDLVEKGEFEKNTKTINKFFTDLKTKMGEKIIDVLFVPGNHDKKRGVLTLPINTENVDETFWEQFKKNDCPYFENQFSSYLETVKFIREEIFKLKATFSGTYGLHNTVVNGYSICFLCLNSAWGCMGDYDMGNLKIGHFQLDDLMCEYQNTLKQGKIDLTIALMHHPTDWLTKIEQKYLNQYMADEYRLNTNIILQGHIHEKDIFNWYNQNHSITTFVTGMGWDQQKNLNDSGHRYSIYEINCNSGIARVNTYVSDSTGTFNEDSKVYNGNNIVFPLYIHKYLDVNRLHFKESEVEYYYPKENILDNIGQLSLQMGEFVSSMRDVIEDYKKEFSVHTFFDKSIYKIIENIASEGNCEIHLLSLTEVYEKIKQNKIYINNLSLYNSYMDAQTMQSYIHKIINMIQEHLRSNEASFNNEGNMDVTSYCDIISEFSKMKTQIFLKEKFLSFLGEFCIRLQKKLFKEKEFEIGNTVRFHFRILENEERIKYKKMFALTMIKNETNTVNCITDSALTDIYYTDSLIEQSFLKNKTLLYSLNPSSNNHVQSEHWIDFLTYAPNTEFNICKCEVDDETSQYPYISFGITVNNSNFQDILRNISYISFDKILTKVFSKFFKVLPYEIKQIIKL